MKPRSQGELDEFQEGDEFAKPATLKVLKAKYQRIAGDWNGEDSRFTSGGIVYDESQAGLAQDIVDAIDNVQDLISNFDF